MQPSIAQCGRKGRRATCLFSRGSSALRARRGSALRCTSRRYVRFFFGRVPRFPPPPSKGMLKEFFGTEQTRGNSTAETKELLSCEPERLGHATYLDDEAREVVLARRTCIEICLTSNLLCVLSLLRSSFSSERGHRVLADAKRCSNSRITTSSITLLGTTPSPSVYVFSYSCTLTSPFNSQVRSVLAHLTDR